MVLSARIFLSKIDFVALVAGLVLTLCGTAVRGEDAFSLSAVDFERGHGLVHLGEQWKFRSGDDPAWADPSLDDGAWQRADIGLKQGAWGGIGWFRLHLEIAPELAHVPLALLHHQQGAAEIYVDGRLQYVLGKVGKTAATEELLHVVDLEPLSLSLDRGVHLIAVRYSNFRADEFRNLGIAPGFKAHLALWDDWVTDLTRKHAAYQMFFTGVPLAFGALHLLLFAFYPVVRANFYYALYTLSIGAVTWMVFEQQFVDIDHLLLLSRVSRISMVAAIIAGMLFIHSLFYARLPRMFWVFLGAGVLIGLWSLNASINYVYVFILLSLAEFLRAVLIAVLGKKEGAWIIGAGMLSFILAVGYQMLLLLEIVGQVGPFSYVYVFGVLAMLISMSIYLARNVGRTNEALSVQLGQVRELSAHLEQKVEERTRELSDKNTVLEETLEQLQRTQDQLVMQEKMAALGNLVAGVAHEINTPIGAVKSAADVSQRCTAKIADALEQGESLEMVRRDQRFQQALKLLADNVGLTVEASERIAKIVRSLRSFARLDEAELQEADLHEGLESTLTLAQHEYKNRIEVVREYGDIGRIYCYPNQLNQVFMNLLINAAQAIEGEGRVTLRTVAEEGVVCVQVVDSGKGMAPEVLDKIFDPGFTTKGVGVGTGLGLSISYKIVGKHEGEIRVESTEGRGSTFTLLLPDNLDERVQHT